MKIALDVSPLESGHKVRGTGSYVKHLKAAFLKYYPKHEYLFFTQRKELRGEISLIHYPYFDPFFLTLPLQVQYPVTVTVHDLIPLKYPEHFPPGVRGFMKWQIQKKILTRVSAVITDSEASKKDIALFTGIPESEIFVTYLAAGEGFREHEVTREEHSLVKQKYNLPDKFALYVGDVTWNKNLPRLMEAIKKAGIPLVLAGKVFTASDINIRHVWNKDLSTIQKKSINYSKVIKVGYVPDNELVTLYNLATVFVMPSLDEGFGLPILEAMQCGCPVVTTRGGSIPEVAGDAAYFMDPYDIENMADSISKVFFDVRLQKKFTKMGKQRVKHFTWEKTAQQTISVYEKIISRK